MPATIHEDSKFSTSLPPFIIICLFDCSYHSVCEGVSHCGLDLCPLMATAVEHNFMYLLTIYTYYIEKKIHIYVLDKKYLIWRNVYADTLPIFKLA